MGKNFWAMPPILKLLIGAAAVLLVFCVDSMLPKASVGFFGRQLTAEEWWSAGLGPMTMAIASIMCVAAVLMLRRSIYGRPVYILAWIALSFSTPLAAHLTGTEAAASVPLLISNLVLTCAIGAYLYMSASTRTYFNSVPK